jgi:hypothetical protein
VDSSKSRTIVLIAGLILLVLVQRRFAAPWLPILMPSDLIALVILTGVTALWVCRRDSIG